MFKPAVFFSLLLLLSQAVTSQTKKVLIMDQFHYHETDDPLQFDLSQHVENLALAVVIIEQTASSIKEKLGVAKVVYYDSSRLTYQPTNRPFDVNFHKIDWKEEAEGADYFGIIKSSLRVSGGQSYSLWSENPTNYVMILEIRIVTATGKKAFRKTVRIRFQARPTAYLYGPLISHKDFESMYTDALKAAFADKKKLAKRNVKYGRNERFLDFMNASDHYMILHKPEKKNRHSDRFVNGTFTLMDDAENTLGQIDIAGSHPTAEFTELFNLNLSNRLLQTSQLKNSITGKSYSIAAGLSTALDYEFEDRQIEIPRVVVQGEQDQVAKFELLDSGKFVGEFEGENFTVAATSELNLFELFHKDELKGVIQLGPYDSEDSGMYRDIAYFKKGIDTEESGRLLSLYFFARIADYIRLKAIEEEDD